MKKSELDTIIKKIQNRCYLENPTKITYYRNENNEVIFKVFFDSLAIPESLRLGVQDIQNTFTVANTYEYEDDFQILSLNQDKGYVEFIPDNQHFHIVNSYKDVNKPEDKKEEALVHLATNKLNESFARSKGYIFQEGEKANSKSPVEQIDNVEVGGAAKNAETAKQTAESGEEKLYEKDAFVIGVEAPCTKAGEQIIAQALGKIVEKAGQNSKAMVFLTVPKNEKLKDVPSTLLSIQDVFSAQVQEAIGKSSIAYLAYEGNKHCLTAVSKVKFQSIHYLTTTAEKGIADNNIAGILNVKDATVVKEDLIEDDSAKALIPVIDELTEKAEGFAKLIKDAKLHSKFTKTCSKGTLKKYEKIKNDPEIKATHSILEDLFGKGGLEEAKAAKKQREDIIKAALQNIENPAAVEQAKTFRDKLQVAMTVAYAQTENSFASIVTDRKQLDNKGSAEPSGMFAGMKQTKATNAGSLTGDAKGDKHKPKRSENVGMMDYWCYMYFFQKVLVFDKVPTELAKDIKDLIAVLSLRAFQEDFPEDKSKDKGKDAEDEKEKDGEEQDEEDSNEDGDEGDKKSDSGDDKSKDSKKESSSKSFGNYERLLEIWGLNE